MNNTTVSDLMEAVSGRVISGGDVTEDGMHLYLDDGKVLIFAGAFVVGIWVEKGTLQ